MLDLLALQYTLLSIQIHFQENHLLWYEVFQDVDSCQYLAYRLPFLSEQQQ